MKTLLKGEKNTEAGTTEREDGKEIEIEKGEIGTMTGTEIGTEIEIAKETEIETETGTETGEETEMMTAIATETMVWMTGKLKMANGIILNSREILIK